MEYPVCDGKSIWILAHGNQPDPFILEDLMVGGYQLQHCAICKSSVLQPPPGTALALLELASSTREAMMSIMRVREYYHGPLAVLDEHCNERRHIFALEIGADDYLQKPVRFPMLTARIEALLRRYQVADLETHAVIKLGELSIDAARREVAHAGKIVPLTTIEFKLLWHLANHAGAIVSRNDIHRALYNRDYNGIDRSVDMYVSRVRKKLQDCPANPKILKTIRGDGYLLVSSVA